MAIYIHPRTFIASTTCSIALLQDSRLREILLIVAISNTV
jgi:hypothetical protein